jgi:hypothetical protein
MNTDDDIICDEAQDVGVTAPLTIHPTNASRTFAWMP